MHMYNLCISCFLKGKEWLCLNCQVKRATGSSEPQKDASLVTSSIKKTTTQPTLLNKSAPGSPQRKGSTPATQSATAEVPKVPDVRKESSPAPGQKTPQESRKTGPQKPPEQTGQTAQKQGNTPAVKQQDSGGFFGFGGSKSQTDAAKPAESVGGKMFGFGSSIFSSASTLISATVQDETKFTPPVSPKITPAKDPKSPKKPDHKEKQKEPQQAKIPPSVQPKDDNAPSKQLSASPLISKGNQSTCPLCKLELNVGSKDPPNYNTCTECKNTVCNQCGFNPMLNVKEVRL